MSKKEKVILQCADCGNEFNAEIWTEINLKDQELDHKLFSDQINVFECDECRNSGLVCYPIKIMDKQSGEQAIAIPLNKILSIDDDDVEDYEENSPAFFVVEIKRKKPLKVSYDLNDLKFEIQRWRGEPFTSYTGPPEEVDIEKGLAKGFIGEEEAAKLRGADWESIQEKMYLEGFVEKKPVDFDHAQDEVLDIYFRLQLELDRSTKIIELSKVKKMKKVNLSKSKYLAGLQCLRRLYLQCYEPNLATQPDEKQQAIFGQGTEVGLFAQKVFPDGVLLSEDYRQHKEAVEHTRELIADKSIPALFEAAFTFEGIYIRVDIMERLSGNRWRMIEVKSSTGVKDYHHPDVAIQKYVLEQLGFSVSHACLMHLNRDYVYDGKSYQYDKLFTIADLTEEIEDIEQELPERIAEQWEVLNLSQPPEIEPGLRCSDPFTCDFYDHCNQPFPEDWVGNLPRMGSKVEQLNEMGITSIDDIPDNFPLSTNQNRARDCFKLNEPCYDEALTGELKELDYPLYFMDFETLFPALPRYKGMRPYDHIPFQWSVHLQKTPESEPEHYEFLHPDETDPREAFITSLLSVLEEHENAPILVYSSFESTRLNDLAGWFPKYAKRIAKVRARLWDLLQVIRNNVYHPRFLGSFSIKYVLPALVPEMSYENMEVADGTEAGLAYERMIGGELDPDEQGKLHQSLLDYCRQDTLAMVRLLDHLQGVITNHKS